MKPEALDALATQTMRPKALEAVAAQDDGEKSSGANQVQSTQDPEASSTAPIPSRSASNGSVSTTDGTTEDTSTAASIVSEVVQTVKTAVDSAISWAETKVECLSAEQDSTGPYSSPATCMPSDLDVIASGVLPAMPTARQYDGSVDDEKKGTESTENSAERMEKSMETGNEGDKKAGEKEDGEAEPKSRLL